MSVKGRVDKLERIVPARDDTPHISDEDLAEGIKNLRAQIAYEGHTGYDANELREALGEEVYQQIFGDVVVTGKAPWGPDGVS